MFMHKEVRSNRGFIGSKFKSKKAGDEGVRVGAAFKPKKYYMAAEAGKSFAEGRGERGTVNGDSGKAMPTFISMGDGAGPTPVIGGFRPNRRLSRGWVYYDAIVLLVFLALPLIAFLVYYIGRIGRLSNGHFWSSVLIAVGMALFLLFVISGFVFMNTSLGDRRPVVAKGGVKGQQYKCVGAEEVNNHGSSKRWRWLPDVVGCILVLGAIAFIGSLIALAAGVGSPYQSVVATNVLLAIAFFVVPAAMLFEDYICGYRGGMDEMYVVDGGVDAVPPIVVYMVDGLSKKGAGQQDGSDAARGTGQSGDQDGKGWDSHSSANDVPGGTVVFVTLTRVNEDALSDSAARCDSVLYPM
ncbi:MAG: hypothetical protein ACTJLL_02460 [Anaplasma sp.]